MFIIIKDGKNLVKQKLVGEYQYKGIQFYFKNNSCYINLLDSYSFIDDSKTKKLTIDCFEVKYEKLLYNIYIYVYENDIGINDYHLYVNNPFLLCNNQKANLICKDKYLNGYYLLYKDKVLETNCSFIEINGNEYHGEIINDGDVVEILGIRIFFYNDFLYINDFCLETKIERLKIKEFPIKYEIVNPKYECSLNEKPIELIIEDLKEYTYKRKIKANRQNIVNNIVMVISMSIIASINYINNTNQSVLQKIVYLIMPISMMLTGIAIPLIQDYIKEKKDEEEYLQAKLNYIEYLDKYKDNLINKIKEYVDSANRYYFSFNNKNKYGRNNDYYLTISLGKISNKKDITIKYTEDFDINNKYDEIKNQLDVNDYPLFLDLKKYKRANVVCKQNSKQNTFYRYLYELCVCTDNEDLYIGIYGKDFYFNDNVYNLPHLFYGDKRLFVSNAKELNELNQLKLDRPLILFMSERNDYQFTNPNIKSIYFSNDKNDVLKNSDVLIEYFNNTGYILDGTKIDFSYIEQIVDYKELFNVLGKRSIINQNRYNISFSSVYKNYNIEEAYKNPKGLKTNFAYDDNGILEFDLHENKHGPHGLIGGSTGSGKSELIVSLLLSLCLNYPPDYLNIILIDYKGAGIIESLTANGKVLPHIIASISNLENNSFERLIIAIRNECLYRQERFKKLSSSACLSIMNIDDYNENSINEKIAHLLIVIDEFAELKKENPTLIKELVSLSRIGRSLGVHLILSTQKPGGNIDDEIWSNSRFKIALKVFEEKDSNDLIKNKDATYLKNKGSFILQVDDSYIKANSIYSKKDINNNEPIEISLLGYDLTNIKTYKENTSNSNSEANYYVNYILDNCKNYKTNKLLFLRPKCKKASEYPIKGKYLLGMNDDYINSKYEPLIYEQDDSFFICSTRKNELNTFINTIDKRRCVTIGSKKYKGKWVSDSLLYDEDNDIKYLFNVLLENDLDLTLMIEDINVLLSYSDEYINIILKLLKRKNKTNYIFVSSSSLINIKLINSFNNRFLIESSDNNDLSNIFSCRSEYNSNSYYYKDKCIGYVPITIDDELNEESILEPIIKRIRDYIKPEIINNECLLGVDIIDRNKVYSNTDLLITSYDKDLLKPYTNFYKERVTTEVYSHKLCNKEFYNVLWLGSGIFSQRLFISSLKDDLKENEGLLIQGNKKRIIRILDNA